MTLFNGLLDFERGGRNKDSDLICHEYNNNAGWPCKKILVAFSVSNYGLSAGDDTVPIIFIQALIFRNIFRGAKPIAAHAVLVIATCFLRARVVKSWGHQQSQESRLWLSTSRIARGVLLDREVLVIPTENCAEKTRRVYFFT